MKPSFEQIPKITGSSQLIQHILTLPEFEPYWHFHPEYELTYIIHGRGKRIVGDSVEEFQDGDLVLLGSNLPHSWNSVKSGPDSSKCKAVVLQFNGELIPGPDHKFPEFDSIRILLEKAQQGLFFYGKEALSAGRSLIQLAKSEGIVRLSGFWLVLNELCRSSSFKLLSTSGYIPSLNKFQGERINTVFRYVAENFAEDIKLRQVAEKIHMTETSFSRFFKTITGETFTEYLTNIRIAHACSLLAEHRDKSVLQVAFESGFKSSTHFNRVFLQSKKCTPGEFRKNYRL